MTLFYRPVEASLAFWFTGCAASAQLCLSLRVHARANVHRAFLHTRTTPTTLSSRVAARTHRDTQLRLLFPVYSCVFDHTGRIPGQREDGSPQTVSVFTSLCSIV